MYEYNYSLPTVIPTKSWNHSPKKCASNPVYRFTEFLIKINTLTTPVIDFFATNYVQTAEFINKTYPLTSLQKKHPHDSNVNLFPGSISSKHSLQGLEVMSVNKEISKFKIIRNTLIARPTHGRQQPHSS